MKTCKQCGMQLEDAVTFCPGCGLNTEQPMEQPAPAMEAQPVQESGAMPQLASDLAGKVKSLNNTADETAHHDPADIQANKVMGILAYIGPLVFVPMFGAKGSRFARFHANQGLISFILNVGYGIVHFILTLILQAIFPLEWVSLFSVSRGAIYNILATVLGLLWIPLAAIAVLGIINAANGKAKELPLVGKFKILK